MWCKLGQDYMKMKKFDPKWWWGVEVDPESTVGHGGTMGGVNSRHWFFGGENVCENERGSPTPYIRQWGKGKLIRLRPIWVRQWFSSMLLT